MTKYMMPIWLKLPLIPPYSAGWKSGYGENYKYEFWEYYHSMPKTDQQAYQELFPAPKIWQNIYTPEVEDNREDYKHSYGSVVFWEDYGMPKYSPDDIVDKNADDLLLFYDHTSDSDHVDASCLSQWYEKKFGAYKEFICAEQYLMAGKAKLFNDNRAMSFILKATEPRIMKNLGKRVKYFDQDIWDICKYSIVLTGNYYKFTHNPELMAYLLGTGDKVLVETNPYDHVWGIKLPADAPEALSPSEWQGQNLLGFALMEVRSEIRRVYKNYHLFDND